MRDGERPAMTVKDLDEAFERALTRTLRRELAPFVMALPQGQIPAVKTHLRRNFPELFEEP